MAESRRNFSKLQKDLHRNKPDNKEGGRENEEERER